ncbi:hypothetical protein ACTJIJ_19825 [Niabella sp. 22666]|uniref:hypothetical protein n=1 Tax=Niabella sp. 22666 TaxID=3453954 RepID=UPI003F824688
MNTQIDSEEFGRTIDRIDNLAAGLNMPLPPQMHIDQLKKILPDISADLKKVFTEIFEENPWTDE